MRAPVKMRLPDSRLLWVLALLAAGTGELGAVPERQVPHQRWRETHLLAAPLERWFMPTELGHEPGRPSPAPGPRAYLTRFLWGADRNDGGLWSERNGLGKAQSFSHNLNRVFPLELFDTRPEFFPLIDGKRWRPAAKGPINWNPDIGEPASITHAAQVAIRHFDADPAAWSFALGVNDGLRFGESPATLRWITPMTYFRSRPNFSDLVFNFMNGVAEQVAPVHPDKRLGALAYYWCEQVPSFPVHPKVMPFLTADRSQGYDRAFRDEEEDLQRRWAAAGPERLGLYDYLYGAGFVVPRVHTALLARNLRHARRVGFTDYFAEQSPHWGLAGPQPWMVAQLLLDPEQDHRVLLKEYYTRFYRDAAGPMRDFFELCERRWMEQDGPVYWLKHFLNDSQVLLYPPEVRRELRGLLDRAAARVADDPVARERVELTSAAFRVSERYVEMVEHRQELAHTLLAAWDGPADDESARERVRTLTAEARAARQRFTDELTTVRTSRPLALAHVHLDFILRSDWTTVADWWLAGVQEKAVHAAECLPNPHLLPPLGSETRIGELVYAPAVPFGWASRTEPWQGMVAEVRPRPAGGIGLRLEDIKVGDFRSFALVPQGAASGGGLLSARVDGHIGPLSRVWLWAFWISADQRNLGEAGAIQLPAGDWDNQEFPVALPEKPPEAAGVLCKFTVLDQQNGEWLDLRSVSLRWIPDLQ